MNVRCRCLRCLEKVSLLVYSLKVVCRGGQGRMLIISRGRGRGRAQGACMKAVAGCSNRREQLRALTWGTRPEMLRFIVEAMGIMWVEVASFLCARRLSGWTHRETQSTAACTLREGRGELQAMPREGTQRGA